MWTNRSRVARSTPAKARRTGKPSPSRPLGAVVTEITRRSAASSPARATRGRAIWRAAHVGQTIRRRRLDRLHRPGRAQWRTREQQIARYSEIVRSHGAAELGLPPTTGCPCLERGGGGRQPPDEVATEAGIRLFQALADWAEWARTVPPAAPTPKPPARPRRRRAPSEAS